jgi:valyl-tRNA synthetase
MDIVRGIRTVRNDYRVDPARRIGVMVAPGSSQALITHYAFLFTRLCNVEHIDLLPPAAPAPAESASVIVSDTVTYLPLAGMVDIAAERERLQKERVSLEQQIARAQGMLANEQFISRAPADVVERERTKLADMQASLTQTVERLALLTH